MGTGTRVHTTGPRPAGALVDYLVRHRLLDDDTVLPEVSLTHFDREQPRLHPFTGCPATAGPVDRQPLTAAQVRAHTTGDCGALMCRSCQPGPTLPAFWRPWQPVTAHLSWLLWAEELTSGSVPDLRDRDLVEVGLRRWLLHTYPHLGPSTPDHPGVAGLTGHLVTAHARVHAHRVRWPHRWLRRPRRPDPVRTWVLVASDPLDAPGVAALGRRNQLLLSATATADLGPLLVLPGHRSPQTLMALDQQDQTLLGTHGTGLRWRPICATGPDVADIVTALELRPDASAAQYRALIAAVAATRS